MKLINPLEDLSSELCAVQNPSRYLGGEVGAIVKAHENDENNEKDCKYNVAIAFPDLYEIAMCNQAVKIIYNGLNKSDNVRCERVFAPDTTLPVESYSVPNIVIVWSWAVTSLIPFANDITPR